MLSYILSIVIQCYNEKDTINMIVDVFHSVDLVAQENQNQPESSTLTIPFKLYESTLKVKDLYLLLKVSLFGESNQAGKMLGIRRHQYYNMASGRLCCNHRRCNRR